MSFIRQTTYSFVYNKVRMFPVQLRSINDVDCLGKCLILERTWDGALRAFHGAVLYRSDSLKSLECACFFLDNLAFIFVTRSLAVKNETFNSMTDNFMHNLSLSTNFLQKASPLILQSDLHLIFHCNTNTPIEGKQTFPLTLTPSWSWWEN